MATGHGHWPCHPRRLAYQPGPLDRGDLGLGGLGDVVARGACLPGGRSSAGSGGQSAGGLQFDLDVIGHSSDVHLATILGYRGTRCFSGLGLHPFDGSPFSLAAPTDDAPRFR